MRKILPLLILLVAVSACQTSLTNRAFRTEQAVATTAKAAVHAFNQYYAEAAQRAPAAKLAQLNEDRESVYAASRKLSVILSSTEAIRQDLVANGADTNKTALLIALEALNAHGSNLVVTVQNLIKK